MMDKIKEENNDVCSISSKLIDFLFSNDLRKYLLLIILFGIILRIVVAGNVSPIADEMVHGPQAVGIISSGVISHQNQCPVWFYLTDLTTKFFGTNAFSLRFLSIFFGSLTIILLYLITKKIFNERTALISAFLLAISSYHIRYALMEMDEAMTFFVLLSFYYFIKGLEHKKISYLSIIFMAIATLIKPISLPFIPGFVIYFFYIFYKEGKEEKKKMLELNYKRIILGSLLFLTFMSPVLVYNYLLYKEKGISDILFARFFNIAPEIYSSLSGGAGSKFSIISAVTDGPRFLFDSFIKLDPLLTLLGLLGLLLISFSKNRLAKFFIGTSALPFIFLLGTQRLQTHFVIFMPLLAFSSAHFISRIESMVKEGNVKKITYLVLIVLFLTNIYLLLPNIISKSAVFQARSFAIDEIKENDIIIPDARIYRGRSVFMFHDKHYLESSYFSQLIDFINNSSGSKIPIKIYFMECVPDDCGWGTVRNQPSFNQSSENLFDFVKNNSQKIKTLYAGGEDLEKNSKEAYFNIYVSTIQAPSSIYQLIDSTHQWFFYPVLWYGERYDQYSLDSTSSLILHKTAYSILWIMILISLASPILLIYELVKNK